MDVAPLYTDVAKGPAGGHAFWLSCSDGLRIRVGHWPRAEGHPAQGTVLLFPGRTEYIEKYGPAAGEFTAAGFDFLTIDWRGQGLADRDAPDRLLGHVSDFAAYQHDVAAMLEAAKALHLPEPFYLVAHSMGGCIGLRALHENLPVKAASFSAPMWGIGLSTWLRPVAWSLSWLFHKIGKGAAQAPATTRENYVQVAPFEDNQLTKDREMWDFMQQQLVSHPDLALGAPTITWLFHALRETAALAKRPAPSVATMTFLGDNERIVASAPVHQIMSGWTNGQLEMVPGGEHEVMMETPARRDAFYAKTIAHFRAHP